MLWRFFKFLLMDDDLTMNIVEIYCNQVERMPENRLINNRVNDWRRRGNALRRRREALGLSRAYIARETKANASRLRRLELGEPVRDAKIIYRVNELILEKYENIIHTN